MNWKQVLLDVGIETLQGVLSALIATSGLGPKFKQACQNTLSSLDTLAVAAETPNE